ncbi:hypothetical protein F3Y22_tig00012104pilonHSYRG00076 [Hibiscus syriacus]|uniref:Phorbol-ester/DAG-type domain-containing protein n=1 Tax=Hibiscus syriacus TaxID=106335 RepID=A0A6A3C9B8_HIBSY|nr:hypothetical protein F3Y22_tig00012104pilonHSYRG00076 [Hibiscus syriacus]
MEMEKKREIKHLFHEHPLVFVEDQSNEGEKAYCSACGDVISDPCFSCAPCNYHLHHNCALAPQTISSHPLHPQHRYGLFLRERPHPGNRVYDLILDMYESVVSKNGKRDRRFRAHDFSCNEVGSLSTGKFADFVVLSTDSWDDFATEVSASVNATYVGGVQAYP